MKRTTIYLTEKQIEDLGDTFNRLAPNINLSLTQKVSTAVEDFIHANREEQIGEGGRLREAIELEAKKDIEWFLGSEANERQKRQYKILREEQKQQDLFRAGLDSVFSTPELGSRLTPKRVDGVVKKLKEVISRENQLSKFNIEFEDN